MNSSRESRVCANKTAIPPDSCWKNGPNEAKALLAQSLRYSRQAGFEDRVTAFKSIVAAMDRSALHLRNALQSLTPVQRFELMRWAVPALKRRLSPLLTDMRVERAPTPARVPDELPERLRQGLVAYRDRLERRQERLLKSGHARSPRYLNKLMDVPIRLGKHLASAGITSWEGMRKRDVVEFLAVNPKVRPNRLTRFLRALAEDKPFRERRGQGHRRSKGGVKPKELQEVMSPEELDRTLASIHATRSPAEYAMAWLVCKMGMTAKAAHYLTLDRLRMDANGRLVIRPADVWVVVPKSAASLLKSLAEEAAPDWSTAPSTELEYIRLFERTVSNIDHFRADVLGGQARKLRASCVYAAMLKGHLDRVTIHQTMGVSLPTIASIERHLSSDVHRKLPQELVEARNKILKGERDV